MSSASSTITLTPECQKQLLDTLAFLADIDPGLCVMGIVESRALRVLRLLGESGLEEANVVVAKRLSRYAPK